MSRGDTLSVAITIAGVTNLQALNFEVVYDQAVLSSPTIGSGPSTDRNPDANQAFLGSTGRTFACSPPAPTGDNDPSPTMGTAFLSCYSTGATAGPSAGSTPETVATVQFTVIDSSVTSTPLTLRSVNIFTAGGVETGSCNSVQVTAATCTGATINIDQDRDDDGVIDISDNCWAWANPTQLLPPWTVPANDPDCDGFSDGREGHMSTDPLLHCNATTTPDDESDAWPVDNNDDQRVTLTDVLRYIPVINSFAPGPPYDPRYDLNASNSVTLTDALMFIPFFNQSCAS